jgi:hypothetical protein
MRPRGALDSKALVEKEDRGRNGKIIDWLDEITADRPKK